MDIDPEVWASCMIFSLIPVPSRFWRTLKASFRKGVGVFPLPSNFTASATSLASPLGVLELANSTMRVRSLEALAFSEALTIRKVARSMPHARKMMSFRFFCSSEEVARRWLGRFPPIDPVGEPER